MEGLNVFLSWSGPLARDVAGLLHELLRHASDQFRPWMSDVDIPSGGRGLNHIAAQLSTTDVGLILVTSANQAAPWLNFEAGALSKQVTESARVIPVLVDLVGTDLASGPISQFQYRTLTYDDILRIMRDLSALAGVDAARVEARLRDRWDDFAAELQRVHEVHQKAPAKRSESELLSDIHADLRFLLQTAGMEARDAGAAYEMRNLARAQRWCEEHGYKVDGIAIHTGHYLIVDGRPVEVLVSLPGQLTDERKAELTSDLQEALGCSCAIRDGYARF